MIPTPEPMGESPKKKVVEESPPTKQFHGRPDRDTIISKDDITDIKIGLNYPEDSVDSFLKLLGVK